MSKHGIIPNDMNFFYGDFNIGNKTNFALKGKRFDADQEVIIDGIQNSLQPQKWRNEVYEELITKENKDKLFGLVAKSIFEPISRHRASQGYFSLSAYSGYKDQFYYGERFGFVDHNHLNATFVVVTGSGDFEHSYCNSTIELNIELQIQVIMLKIEPLREMHIAVIREFFTDLKWRDNNIMDLQEIPKKEIKKAITPTMMVKLLQLDDQEFSYAEKDSILKIKQYFFEKLKTDPHFEKLAKKEGFVNRIIKPLVSLVRILVLQPTTQTLFMFLEPLNFIQRRMKDFVSG
uniref:Uncharacterized protein n=1 Tax=Panagrolaimus sp. JU765 TaxID=591449 RepID=A0AC34RMP3_9BILA